MVKDRCVYLTSVVFFAFPRDFLLENHGVAARTASLHVEQVCLT